MSVSNDETAQEAGNFGKQFKVTFPVVHDPKGTIFNRFGVSPIPANVVVDRAGKVVFQQEGENLKTLEAAVQKAVARK